MTNREIPSPTAVWVDGDPLMEAIAAAVWEQCGRSDSGSCVEDDPRTIAAVAAAVSVPPPATRADDQADVDLADGPVRCPLCVHTVTLHTPNGARAHFTAVHPEQRITGRGHGPWPLLVTDGAEEQQPGGPCVAGEQQNETPEAETPTTTKPAASPSVVDEVVAALQAKAQALSVEAEEEMRRDLEDQAQVWHEAADLARRTGRKAVRNAQPTAKPETDGEGAATRFNWSDIIPAPVDETAQERDRLIDCVNRVRVALRDCKERAATGMQYEIAVREAIGDREPRRGPGPLCHESDPRTLRECALKANHGGDHEDGDLSWPRSAEHQPAAGVRQDGAQSE